MNPKNGTLDWVQAMRGIAAFLVVLCHSSRQLNPSVGADIKGLFITGAMGVDLFFIISGFIMVYATRNVAGGARGALDFAIKRLARIWPVYVVITLIWVCATGHGLNYFHDGGNWIVLLKSFSFVPVKYGSILSEPALSLGWTLNFEIYFYLIFGVSLLFRQYRLIVLSAWILFTVWAIPAVSGGLLAISIRIL